MHKKQNILITGGAGFIGSNLVSSLIKNENIDVVRVLDNLSTGFIENIKEFNSNPKFEFIEGDIRDFNTCMEACKNMDLISHQAALGSVPRSIKDPITTNEVNISGTLNILKAAVESKINKIVFAASSSTYGDNVDLPKKENKIGAPLSPYAVTKLVNEIYADVFARTYGLNYIGLRYFNVFGPNQSPKGGYAAVIPLFMQAAIQNSSPKINGDGEISRDFTYIENVVQANLKSLFTTNKKALNQIYNVACGDRTTLNELWSFIQEAANKKINAIHGPTRLGDILHSEADISKARELLTYNPTISVKEGIRLAYDWYKNKLK